MQGVQEGDGRRVSRSVGEHVSPQDSSSCYNAPLLFLPSTRFTWQVAHYDRRRKYLQFKEKLEKGGYDPIEEHARQSGQQ